MTEVNWNRPIVTNVGKPARVLSGPDADNRLPYYVEGDFGDGVCSYFLSREGEWSDVSIRNATPAEILAHPDVWPEWQDEAREMQMKADVAEVVQQVVARSDGVFVTRAMLANAIRKTLVHDTWAGPIADALGIPPDPPKQAPWEVAYELWARPLNDTGWDGWKAGVMWAMQEALSVSEPNAVMSSVIRNRIMGGKHD